MAEQSSVSGKAKCFFFAFIIIFSFHLPIIFNYFLFKDDFISRIGQGAYGKVYLARNKRTFKQLVIKVIECMTDEDAEDVDKEIEFMSRFSHPFIVMLEERFTDRDNICIVMEYCENGDLSGLIKQYKKRGTYMPEPVWPHILPRFFFIHQITFT